MKIIYIYLIIGNFFLLLFDLTSLHAEEFIFQDGSRCCGKIIPSSADVLHIRFYHRDVKISPDSVLIKRYSLGDAFKELALLHPNQPEKYFELGRFLITSPDSLVHRQSRRALLLVLKWLPEKEEEIHLLLGTITKDSNEKRKHLMSLVLNYPEKEYYQTLFQEAQTEFILTENNAHQNLKDEISLLNSAIYYHFNNEPMKTMELLKKSSKERELSKLLKEKVGFNYSGWISNLEKNRPCSECSDRKKVLCKCEGTLTQRIICRRCKGSGRMAPSLAVCTTCNGSRVEDIRCTECQNGWVTCQRCIWRRKPPLVSKARLQGLEEALKKSKFLEHWSESSAKLPTEYDSIQWLEDPLNCVFLNGRWMTLKEKEHNQNK